MIKNQSLVGLDPKDVLPYGSTKLLVDEYLWHKPDIGGIASYTVKARDVKDHFGLFRGADQLEFFAQSSIVSLGMYIISEKASLKCSQILKKYNPAFLGVDRIRFCHFAKLNETIISVSVINKYKFKQVTCSGKIYKVPDGFNLKSYCSSLSSRDVENFNIHEALTIVAEFENAVGWCVKKEKFV